jgi:DNA-binding beta-propeller fold protein YncE
VVQAWGGKVSGGVWETAGREHGINVDAENNVWLTFDGGHVVMKFTREGKHLLTIGVPGKTGGSNSQTLLGRPTRVAVDTENNEIYVSDGYINRRVIVFDTESGKYKRHWGAYGQNPVDDKDPGPYDPNAPPSKSFTTSHGVALSNDKLVYVADRVNNRVQVFRPNGEFVMERILTKTRGSGAAWTVAFSPDPAQEFVYVPDGTNGKVWILRRKDMSIIGNFARFGRPAGYLIGVHDLAVDPQGNIYTVEVYDSKRLQKFTFKGFRAPENGQ